MTQPAAQLYKSVLYTDMDGTLLADDKSISPDNMAALRRFTELGGRFSVASGRNVDGARPFLEILPVNAPAILYNGAAVYDPAQDRFLHEQCLDPVLAAELMRFAVEIEPGCCTQTYHAGRIRLYNPDGPEDPHMLREGHPHEYIPLGDRCERAFKAMVYGDAAQLEHIRLAVLERFGEGRFHCTYSSSFYLEFLDPNATKGAALQWIQDHLPGFSHNDVAAIGDYYNDVEMLRSASLSAAVANAPDDIRSIADTVVCDNNHSALADLIGRFLIRA